ncbi:MAG: dTDP-glucose 4,6-dehydratase [Actinomycetota bacterium]
MRVVVTGGLGFIGSAVVRHLLADSDHEILNVDAETYAATRTSVADAVAVATAHAPARYRHVAVDITDGDALRKALDGFRPEVVIHLAAESHVDRSIDGPGAFVATNVVGTYEVLQAARATGTDDVRVLHVSTDEVFGSLGADDAPFDETTPYDPRSPYSASKAASDHLVRAWHHTYDLATIITNCSNNYGPYQFPEKLIPLMIIKALAGEPLPVYGTGDNVRDWLFVEDHARAIVTAATQGDPGQTYAIGGDAERTNLEVVETICDLVDDAVGVGPEGPRRRLIAFVTDRPGHDHRYAINPEKAHRTLGWEPSLTFTEGLARTVAWYLDNGDWWRPLLSERYDGGRLGGTS